QAYKKLWSDPVNGGRAVPLSDNFRSREVLLDFVNSFFQETMREETGGVAYDDDARLKFAAPDRRVQFGRKAAPSPQVEFHLRVKTKGDEAIEQSENGAPGNPDTEFANLDSTE